MSYGFRANKWHGKSEGVTRRETRSRYAFFISIRTKPRHPNGGLMSIRTRDAAVGGHFKKHDEPIATGPSRLPIWPVNHCFECPVVGMCSTLAEQKRLLKKLGRLEKTDGPFEMHETLVASLDRENRLSRRVDNLLERKFGKQAAVLLQLDDQSFLANFKMDSLRMQLDLAKQTGPLYPQGSRPGGAEWPCLYGRYPPPGHRSGQAKNR